MHKSFIDILFILLCGTIVMLSNTLYVGTLETSPAKLGSGGVSELCADEVQIVAVYDNHLETINSKGEAIELKSAHNITNYIAKTNCILLMAGNETVSHHQLMLQWDICRQLGFNVKLGAINASPNIKE
ncbi:MAG: hypothetical protein JEZ07_14400 [Phycisphaerae bacterium]|nr:hypothetical protein [Phycisphaerae bacterium]